MRLTALSPLDFISHPLLKRNVSVHDVERRRAKKVMDSSIRVRKALDGEDSDEPRDRV